MPETHAVPSQTSYDEDFCEKAPSKMFDWVLNKLLNARINSIIQELSAISPCQVIILTSNIQHGDLTN